MKYPKCYAVKHMCEEVVAESRSGGIFTAISDYILNLNGVVYGCILDDMMKAIHVRAETVTERDRMRGSKYVQSDLGNTFKHVMEDLDSGRIVLFTGTPCQVSGLRKYLGKMYRGLICVDVLCHGVASPLIWREYRKWLEDNVKATIVFAEFRNKRAFGWRDHVETFGFSNGIIKNSKVFTKIYYSHNVLRESCYTCQFKTIKRIGDISIADYWKIEIAAPEFDDNKGVSLVIVNNDVGMRCFESVKNCLQWKKTKLEDSMQNALVKPYPRPIRRDKFWEEFRNKGFNYIVKKYGKESLKSNLKRMYKVAKSIIIKWSGKGIHNERFSNSL